MSTSTTHPVSPEELMALLDGELLADRAQSVSAHTASCETCQQLFASLLHTAHTLTGWTVGAAPSVIEDRVRSTTKTKSGTLARADIGRIRSKAPRRWLLPVMACGGAFIFLVLLSARRKPAAPALEKGERWSVDNTRLDQSPQTAAFESNGKLSRSGDAVRSLSVDGALASAGKARSMGEQREFEALDTYVKLKQVPHAAESGPMIARTVSLVILVKDFDASHKSLEAILARYHGYSANLMVNTPQGAARSLQASLRIPAPQLSPALAELKALGHVETENQNGEEVTQQHADLLARLKNARETEQRLQAILTERTGKISDVLEVEQEIARVRGEIEQMEAEQQTLEHRVDFATVDLRLSEEYKVKLDSALPSFSTQFHNAVVNGYRNLTDTLAALVLFFAEYGPILVFWAALLSIPAWFGWRRWRQVTATA